MVYCPARKIPLKYRARNLTRNTPGSGYCLWCGAGCDWKETYSIKVTESIGFFPCCKECWSEMTLAQKILCTTHLYEVIWQGRSDGRNLQDYIDAVKKDHGCRLKRRKNVD